MAARQTRPDDVGSADDVAALLAGGDGGVRAVYQPIVELATGTVVGFEALARGPEGSELERPDRLFAAAAAAGRLAELDWACRTAALAGAAAGGLASPLALFVNVEPAALGGTVPVAFTALADRMAGRLPVVVEFTERALAADPPRLLGAVEWVRGLGWGVAVDDIGAERASLALMPFLAPDVLKLDLRLVQRRATVEIAEVVTAVNAQAERTGALVLAEGIETVEHARLARAMGARFGQGWLYGRPGPLPQPLPGVGRSETPAIGLLPSASWLRTDTPFALVAESRAVQRSTKPLLVAMCKHLERQAFALGSPAVVAASFQHARHFTTSTARRYATLAGSAELVVALGEGLTHRPAPGVIGASVDPFDPIAGEWNLVVVGPHFAGAVLARDLGDAGPDADRRFDYVVTYDRDLVLAAAAALLRRAESVTAPTHHYSATVSMDRVSTDRVSTDRLSTDTVSTDSSTLTRTAGTVTAPSAFPGPRVPDDLLARAVAETSNGVTIADANAPDLPLIYVNTAFERLTGYPSSEVLGRNCRFLQGPDTDPEAVAAMGAALRAGRPVRATIRNYRADGTGWWNQVQLSPVRDEHGRVTHYIGIQDDVTGRIEAEQAAARSARTDPLTGLANRGALREHLTAELARAVRTGASVGVLFADLDGFKAVNDRLGHPAGDRLLAAAAGRLRAVLRGGDLIARYGGDEFVAVLSGLRHDPAAAVAAAADQLRAAMADPYELDGLAVTLGISVGGAVGSADGDCEERLLAAADLAMYADKQAHGRAD